MAIETELKLRIAPEHMERLKRHPFLRKLAPEAPASGRAVSRKLYNIYYDTPSLALQNHAMALRLRHAGKQWLQTLKGGGGVEAGLHSRNEWETPVAGEALDFAALAASGGKLPPGVHKKLRPVFATDFTRSVRQLHYEGASIELCMDSGLIRAGTKTRPISELELELKSGAPQQLFKLALALLDIVPLEVEHASKAEYGYRLYSGGKAEPAKAPLPQLAKTQPAGAALRSMIAACLQHVQANVPGALENLDEEYLHQVRVGLRRVRVALATAAKHCPDAELAALRQQIAALCAALGRAREWDVFLTQTLPPILARLPRNAALRELTRAAEKIRKQHHAAMQASLAAPDFQRLLLRLGHWMQGPYWQAPEAQGRASLAEFGAQILQKRSKQLNRRGKQLAGADEAQLHALRIACKKLRYSAEMFASLFGAAKAARYLAALAAVQDILGQINDISAARRLLGELDNENRRETRALILGWMEHDYALRMAELKKAWKRFAGQGAFWER